MDVPSQCTIVRTGRQGQRIAQGSRIKHTKSMSVALCNSGQHCNERSIVIELNEKSSLRLHLSLSLSFLPVVVGLRLLPASSCLTD